MQKVNFSYTEDRILNQVDLDLKPGSVVVLMGPNGSGKSTIANLILGLYRPQDGLIFAEEHRYEELDIRHLRKSFGVVQQDPVIFSGTIVENITYGNPEVSYEDVLIASKIATAYEFIKDLPDGFETLTGENGVLLSGGQCQRIAIARAMILKSKFVLLDEPTSALDISIQAQIIELLRGLQKKKQAFLFFYQPRP